MILILKHKWFDMIAGGVKREEYRDYNHRYLRLAVKIGSLPPSQRVIEFRRGYTKTAVKVSVKGIGILRYESAPWRLMAEGFKLKPYWGFERNRELIIFRLGEIVK